MGHVINQLVLNEVKIVDVLENRFGYGSIYLPANEDGYDYSFAKEKGSISDDGHITKRDRHLDSKYFH